MIANMAEIIAAHPGLETHANVGLIFDGAPLCAIAHAHGTPTWVTGAETLRARYRRLSGAMGDISIHYAIKANDQLALLRALAQEGAGADAVSRGEWLRARQAGIPASRIILSGVGKSPAELKAALEDGIGQINVESEEELFELAEIAQQSGHTARIALRVNPDVDAGTLDAISTGRAGDKFGVPIAAAASLYATASGLRAIHPVGLAVHIGSQIHKLSAFAQAYGRMAKLVTTLRGHGLAVEAMDCGGGLAIPYQGEPSILPEAWAGCIRAAFSGLDLKLAIEPGRWLAGPAGLLLASVIRTRRAGLAQPIVILDAAMNDLARPAMYGAYHAILPISSRALASPALFLQSLAAGPELVTVAGPVCESSDIFARARPLPPLSPGDQVAILDTGAYGSTMSSTYNARPLAAQVMADPADPAALGGFRLTRARADHASLWAREIEA